MKPSRSDKAKFVIFLTVLVGFGLFLIGFLFINATNFLFGNSNSNNHQVSQPRNSQITSSSNQHYSTAANHSNYAKTPSDNDVISNYQFIAQQLKPNEQNGQLNHHGAVILNHNQANLAIPKSPHEFAANTTDKQHRPSIATAFLTKHSRQYQNRQQTNNGANNWKPLGYHQETNLGKPYPFAYNRGHLLAYALVGNINHFDASEHNHNNIVTETMWANQANTKTNTGQNYYEGLIRKALDHNKQVLYQVTPIYGSDNYLVPQGIHLQAKSTDNQLNFNVYIPNIQPNIDIDYRTGHVILK